MNVCVSKRNGEFVRVVQRQGQFDAELGTMVLTEQDARGIVPSKSTCYVVLGEIRAFRVYRDVATEVW